MSSLIGSRRILSTVLSSNVLTGQPRGWDTFRVPSALLYYYTTILLYYYNYYNYIITIITILLELL